MKPTALAFSFALALTACDDTTSPGTDADVAGGCTTTGGADVADGATETRVRYATASVPVGQSCAQETQTRTCADGAWGEFDGTYTFAACTPATGPSCTTTQSGCGGIALASCASRTGCAQQVAGCHSTGPSSTYSCSSFTGAGDAYCGSIGCAWAGGQCAGGSMSCNGRTEAECGVLNDGGFDCAWDGSTMVCGGDASDCETYAGEAACNAQAGCSWQ